MRSSLKILALFMVFGIFCATAEAIQADLEVTLSDSSTSRGDDDQTFEPGDTFYVHLKITCDDSEDITTSDDIRVRIDVEGLEVYDEINHIATTLADGESDYIVVSSNSFNNDWKENLMDYDCGEKDVTVEISDAIDEIEDSAQLTYEEAKDEYLLRISLDPESPVADSKLTVTVFDDDNDEVSSAYVKITELGSDDEWDDSDDTWKDRTDSGGEADVTLDDEFRNPEGTYQVDAWKSGYCKDTVTFEVSNQLVLTGPDPPQPHAGSSFRMRITNEAGDPIRLVTVVLNPGLLRGTTDTDGYARFTVDSPGTFTAAASATNYEDANPISFTVYSKPALAVSVSPASPKIGDSVTITVTASSSPIAGAVVSISLPDGTERTFTTSSSGKAVYTAQFSGYHSVDASKADYDDGAGSFTVTGSLSVSVTDIANKQPGEDVTVTVKDGGGALVQGASVSILGTDISGTTDLSGTFTFPMPTAGTYTLHITKTGYAAKDVPLSSSGNLVLRFSNQEPEVGETVKITVYDDSGMKVFGEIEVLKPDGTRETATTDELDYVPNQAGDYGIVASKENYASASETLKVRRRSIVFSLKIEENTLRIIALSLNTPAQDVALTVTTPSGAKKEVVTDADGVALLAAEESGEYSVSTADPNYESGVVTITKKGFGSYVWWIILGLLVILVFILIVGVGVFHWHFKRKRKRRFDRDGKSALS